MSIAHNMEDTIRIHDKAFMRWLSGLHVDYGTAGGVLAPARDDVPILRRFTAPSRVAADVMDFLIQLGWVAPDFTDAFRVRVKESGLAVLPLPIASVQRGDPVLDPEISGVPKTFRRREFDALTGQWKIHPFPGHYRTDYTVTFWCHKMFTANFIREWVMSQVGVVGCAANERLIPVTHDAPVGEKQQSLKMTGSSDMSNLEGSTEPRYLRFQFIFSLRTLFYRTPTETAYPVETVEPAAVQFTDQQFGVTGVGGASLGVPAHSLSGNLFEFLFAHDRIPTLWPTTGNAGVACSPLLPKDSDLGLSPTAPALRCNVTTEDDAVELCERLAAPDSGGYGLYAIWFDYLATQYAALEISHRNYDAAGEPETAVLVRTRTLPATRAWAKVTQFVPVSRDSILIAVAGVGTASVVHAANINIRRVLPYTQHWCFHAAMVGPENQLTWDDLEAGAYYLCVAIVASGAGTFLLGNKSVGATDTQAEAYDATENLGSCLLQRSLDGTMILRFPLATTLTSVWLVRYYDCFYGNG